MQLHVDALEAPTADRRAFEVVERKGLGHPDTICDAIAEELSLQLCRFYRDRFGAILHHNVDKALLRGGAARPAFGGGEVLEPMELLLAGRATCEFRGVAVPVADLADQVARRWLRAHFHALDPDRHVRVTCLMRPGSSELVELFGRPLETGTALANDTSCGVGFAPFGTLERLVLEVERHLNARTVKGAHPEIGQDVKLMGVRRGEHIDLTLACAMVDRFIADVADYGERLHGVAELAREAARAATGRLPEIRINAGDDPTTGRIYLTVTGTSAEAGDDGEVGRGNRANGLITPLRPMTLEAAAGKNPVTHVGKLYNLLAGRIAQRLVDALEEVVEAHCCLVSEIGRPVADPAAVGLEIRTRGAPLSEVRGAAEELAVAELARAGEIWKELVDGAVPLY